MISYSEYEKQYKDIIKIVPEFDDAFRMYHEALRNFLQGSMVVPREGKMLEITVAYAYPMIGVAFKGAPSHIPEGQVVKNVKQKIIDLKENRTDIPVLTFFMTGMKMDQSRMLPSHVKYHTKSYDESKKYGGATSKDLPFDLTYQLSIWTKLKSDMGYFQQQFLVNFAPLLYLEVNKQNIPFRLDAITDASILESSQGAQQLIRYEITLTAQAWLRTPITKVPMIRKEAFHWKENTMQDVETDIKSYNVRTEEKNE